MRLSESYRSAIKAAALEAFGATVEVRLFGSRVDDERRGGDIDLHILAPADQANIDNEIKFRAAVWRLIDEQQIDVVVAPIGGELRWIDKAALRDGIVL